MSIQMTLRELGWNDHFEKLFNEMKTEGTIPARVATVQRELYQLHCEVGELKALRILQGGRRTLRGGGAGESQEQAGDRGDRCRTADTTGSSHDATLIS